MAIGQKISDLVPDPRRSRGLAVRGSPLMDVLKTAAIGAEVAVLGATATVAWGLVADSGDIRVTAPIIVAATALELTRLPLVVRVPQLGFAAGIGALTLAASLSIVTAETLALGVDSLLTARSFSLTAAETRLAEAQVSFDAAKADGARRDEERNRLAGEVAAAQTHSEEIGRETVALQNNAAVSAYRTRKGWAAPGSAAAGAIAAANARAQAEHAHRSAAAEADLATARAALTALKPVDIKAEEENLVAAKRSVDRERAANPMSRIAASFHQVDTENLRAEDYQGFRRFVTLSLATLMAVGTLAAGLISALPERGDKPSKLARAIRAMVAARRKRLRHIEPTIEYRYRDRVLHVPVDTLGRVLDPDARSS